MIQYFDAVFSTWSFADIIGLNDKGQALIQGLAGSLAGYEWYESFESLEDPELYRKSDA